MVRTVAEVAVTSCTDSDRRSESEEEEECELVDEDEDAEEEEEDEEDEELVSLVEEELAIEDARWRLTRVLLGPA